MEIGVTTRDDVQVNKDVSTSVHFLVYTKAIKV